MEYVSTAVLIAWVPVSMAFFAFLPPRRAVVSAAIFGWLFLPVARVALPGLPDLTKASAPMAGLMLGVLCFDQGRLLALRPRWCDLPILAWCSSPFLSSMSNGLGPYDGVSGVLNHAINWGLPYLIGRIYLGDAEGQRALALGIIVGGLAYVPLCLIEIRISPQLHRMVYGVSPSSFGQTIRYGGYRPQIFMSHGLELGMWMTSACLAGWSLWSTGALTRLGRFSFGRVLLPALLVTTVLCKSTGSLLLLAAGVAVLWLTRLTGRSALVWALMLIAPIYCTTRVSGLWKGGETVDFFNAVTGGDRGQSLEFRLQNEELLMAKAMERPVFGWAGWGRGRVYNDEGKDITVTDGLWVIALSTYGLFGLTAVTATTLAPLVVFAVRHPPASWGDPVLAPAAAVAVLLGLLTADDLSNAMFNPIFILGAGGLMAMPAGLPRHDDHDAGASEAFEAATQADQKAGALWDSMRRSESSGLESNALGDSERAWRFALSMLTQAPVDPSRRPALAHAHEAWATSLTRLGLTADAVSAREEALRLRASLAAEDPHDPEALRQWADALNDLAWLLTVGADSPPHDCVRAVGLAGEAVRLSPGHAPYWNTLACTLVRSRTWQPAIESLNRSMNLSGRGTCFDHLLLALAYLGQGDVDRARPWFDAAVAWLDSQPAIYHELNRLRSEAETLFGNTAARATI